MKYAASARKTARTARRIPGPEASAGPNGVAIAPPDYGIDVVDSQVIQAVPASGQAQQPPAPENKNGLPDNLKAGIEALSGMSMDDVQVHYNSAKPAELQALAFTQGTDIHIGPGQERHLPHEAWHVAQQKQGRVRPTVQMKGKINVNDDTRLEEEADVMGHKAFRFVDNRPEAIAQRKLQEIASKNPQVQQTAQLQSKANNHSARTTQRKEKSIIQLMPAERDRERLRVARQNRNRFLAILMVVAANIANGNYALEDVDDLVQGPDQDALVDEVERRRALRAERRAREQQRRHQQISERRRQRNQPRGGRGHRGR